MENVLILFDGSHLAYSPTTIQLYDELSKYYKVSILAQYPKNYNGQALNDRNVIYHKCYRVRGRYFYLVLFQLVLLFNKEARILKKNGLTYKDYFFRFLFIKKLLNRNKYHRIICMDNTYLFFCSMLQRKVDFLSLELCVSEQLIPLVDRSIINCVIIQSKERYEYLFKDEQLKCFFIQNAPTYKELALKQKRQSLIYTGSTIRILGFYKCLDYLNAYTDEVLTVQGAVFAADKEEVNKKYSHLIEQKRLVINDSYLENNEMVPYLSNFEIGFCFYLFEDDFMQKNYFNYYSAPSGKMFKYLAAGVPVICSNILGFRFVGEMECGILLENLDEQSIREAILKIRANYNFYVNNTIKAAKHFSFGESFEPYLNFIA